MEWRVVPRLVFPVAMVVALGGCTSASPPKSQSTATDSTGSVSAAAFDPKDIARVPDLLRFAQEDTITVISFADARRAPGESRHLTGTFSAVMDISTEPNVLFLDVRTQSGEVARVVVNKNSIVVLPGSSEETAVVGYVEDLAPDQPDITSGWFDGTVKELRIGALAHSPTLFVVNARLTNK